MKKNYTFHKRKVWIVFFLCLLMILCLIGRLIYLMGFRSDYYYEKAEDLHERERDIKAARGEIVDAKGKVLAANKTVCTTLYLIQPGLFVCDAFAFHIVIFCSVRFILFWWCRNIGI